MTPEAPPQPHAAVVVLVCHAYGAAAEAALLGGDAPPPRTLAVRAPLFALAPPGPVAEALRRARQLLAPDFSTRVVEVPLESLQPCGSDCRRPEEGAAVEAVLAAARLDDDATHFCYLDLGLLDSRPWQSRQLVDDAVYEKLAKILAAPRPGCTMLMLEYWPPEVFDDLADFYRSKHFQLSVQFWTIDAASALVLLPALLELRAAVVAAGFGGEGGDEPMWARLVDGCPERFTLTLGDYQDVIDNYFGVTANVERCLSIVTAAMQHGDASRASKLLLENRFPPRETTTSSRPRRILGP